MVGESGRQRVCNLLVLSVVLVSWSKVGLVGAEGDGLVFWHHSVLVNCWRRSWGKME